MLEYLLEIAFVSPCLGNTRRELARPGAPRRHYWALPRTPSGHITFQPTWWQANLRKSATVLSRAAPGLAQVRFDPQISGVPQAARPENFYRRYYTDKIYALHEAFFPGEVIGVRVLVPLELPVDLLRQVLETSGRFYGISPAKPGEFGHFQVQQLAPYKFVEPSLSTEP